MIEFLTADTSSTASLLVTFLPMVLILVFMYIILYLPQKKQDKKDAAMRASIEVGDTVITIGGVVGRVAAINDKDSGNHQRPCEDSLPPFRYFLC